MYDNTIHRDYVQTELEYRLGRIRSDIVGRRRRRRVNRTVEDGLTWTKVR
jgi:hypothetical protein